MNTSRKARLWLADFPSDEARDTFFEEVYTEDGDASCPMWEDLGIRRFDHDCQEVIAGDWREYVQSISQAAIPTTWLEAQENTALILYEIDGPVEPKHHGALLRYLGEFEVNL